MGKVEDGAQGAEAGEVGDVKEGTKVGEIRPLRERIPNILNIRVE